MIRPSTWLHIIKLSLSGNSATDISYQLDSEAARLRVMRTGK